MKNTYFTIAGMDHYYGSDFIEKDMKVKLIKEPDLRDVGYNGLCVSMSIFFKFFKSCFAACIFKGRGGKL